MTQDPADRQRIVIEPDDEPPKFLPLDCEKAGSGLKVSPLCVLLLQEFLEPPFPNFWKNRQVDWWADLGAVDLLAFGILKAHMRGNLTTFGTENR